MRFNKKFLTIFYISWNELLQVLMYKYGSLTINFKWEYYNECSG